MRHSDSAARRHSIRLTEQARSRDGGTQRPCSPRDPWCVKTGKTERSWFMKFLYALALLVAALPACLISQTAPAPAKPQTDPAQQSQAPSEPPNPKSKVIFSRSIDENGQT